MAYSPTTKVLPLPDFSFRCPSGHANLICSLFHLCTRLAREPPEYLVSDTRLLVRLPTALGPAGGRTRLRISYHYTLPESGGRTGWTATPNGEIYDIAQWYPRMAVYDDVRGWDTLPFLGNEFYLEYGDFDYEITVPADMIVAGSGALMNPQAVLTPREKARLTAALASDETVMVRSA